MFTWIEDLKETSEVIFKNHKYKIKASKIHGNYKIDLFEDNVAVVFENTSNKSFLDLINKDEPINLQILNWAALIIDKKYNNCDRCKESKLVFELNEHDDGKEFLGLKKICKKCRQDIYDEIFSNIEKAHTKKSNRIRKLLEKNPPVIIGGFEKRIDAYKYMRNLPDQDIKKVDKNFIIAKAIMQANDNSFYPVFCAIDISSGGELWDTLFIIKDDFNTLISQEYIFPYIGKEPERIFPYHYETLSVIGEDFHQDSLFGHITYNTVRHHFSNLIQVELADSNIEDDYAERFNSINVRTYFSIQHLLSVSIALKQIKALEKKLNNHYDELNFLTHRSLCIGAIFSSVSFLEAAINELFMDSNDNPNGIVRDIPIETINELSQMWELGIPRTANYTIIEKYQIALTLAKKNKMNVGVKPVQDVSSLIKLRNALIHYEPEWVVIEDSNSNSSQKIEKLLKNKFDINPFTGVNNPFFPDKCLSLGCIKWALDSVVSFCDNFFISMGVVPPYEKIRFKIGILSK